MPTDYEWNWQQMAEKLGMRMREGLDRKVPGFTVDSCPPELFVPSGGFRRCQLITWGAGTSHPAVFPREFSDRDMMIRMAIYPGDEMPLDESIRYVHPELGSASDFLSRLAKYDIWEYDTQKYAEEQWAKRTLLYGKAYPKNFRDYSIRYAYPAGSKDNHWTVPEGARDGETFTVQYTYDPRQVGARQAYYGWDVDAMSIRAQLEDVRAGRLPRMYGPRARQLLALGNFAPHSKYLSWMSYVDYLKYCAYPKFPKPAARLPDA
jgi:hypothetical protein